MRSFFGAVIKDLQATKPAVRFGIQYEAATGLTIAGMYGTKAALPLNKGYPDVNLSALGLGVDIALLKLTERGRLIAGKRETVRSGKPLAGSTINRDHTQLGSVDICGHRLKLVQRNDAGHFALETHAREVAMLIRAFLDDVIGPVAVKIYMYPPAGMVYNDRSAKRYEWSKNNLREDRGRHPRACGVDRRARCAHESGSARAVRAAQSQLLSG